MLEHQKRYKKSHKGSGWTGKKGWKRLRDKISQVNFSEKDFN
jgi:hypothetical protein